MTITEDDRTSIYIAMHELDIKHEFWREFTSHVTHITAHINFPLDPRAGDMVTMAMTFGCRTYYLQCQLGI